MILADSLMALVLDFLLMETANSSSDLMLKSEVVFFIFLFSHIYSRPVAKRIVDDRRKGSSAASSSLRDLTSVSWWSYDLTHLSRA